MALHAYATCMCGAAVKIRSQNARQFYCSLFEKRRLQPHESHSAQEPVPPGDCGRGVYFGRSGFRVRCDIRGSASRLQNA